MLRCTIPAFALILVAANDSGKPDYADDHKYAVLAKDKFQDLAHTINEIIPIVAATTYEGQMKILEAGKAIYPPGILSPKAMAGKFRDGEGSEVMKKEFMIWSKHDYHDGPEINSRVLAGFEAEFAAQTGTEPPDWIGMEHALDDPVNLRAALDLSLAYIKNYELDKCEVLLGTYALPASRVRGLPFIVKALQDFATLRMKQNRQAEALLMLEELESLVPPDPIMLHNLGLVYNSLKMHDKALERFKKKIALKVEGKCFNCKDGQKEGELTYDDNWDLAITTKRMGDNEGAFAYFIKALELASADPNMDEVTLAKITNDVGECLHQSAISLDSDAPEKLSIAKEAEVYLRDAVELYRATLGVKHHLYGGACRALARNLMLQGRSEEGDGLMYEALWIEVVKNSIHPTPCFYMIQDLLDLHDQGGMPPEEIGKYHDLLRAMLMHLYSRGFAADGNGGVVMQIIAKFLLLSEQELVKPALALLRKALELVENEKEEVPTGAIGVIRMKIQVDIQRAESILAAAEAANASDVQLQPERWLFEGPWGMPPGADTAFGVEIVLGLPDR